MKKTVKKVVYLLAAMILGGCANKAINTKPANPPYNNFDQSSDIPFNTAKGILSGALVGAVVSPENPGLGAAIGGAVGGTFNAAKTAHDESVPHLIELLGEESVQVVQHGRLVTVIIPTDKYYIDNSYELNDLQFEGLNHIAQLVLWHSEGRIYVSGFTDNFWGSTVFGETDRVKMSEERAESMADFLWANGVPLSRMVVKGYGERHDIADNFLIHGAAMNRRVEIQWETTKCPAIKGVVCQDYEDVEQPQVYYIRK